MGLVYLPTFTIEIKLNVGEYTSPMDPMGYEVNKNGWFSKDF